MGNLWFKNSRGEEYLIAAVDNMTDVFDCIYKFIDQRNEGKPANKRFKPYYIRTWEENGRTKVDVGSWSEFFYTDVSYERNDLNDSKSSSKGTKSSYQ